jgi:leucyl/phenylalanyl-tRNA--protein transferase
MNAAIDKAILDELSPENLVWAYSQGVFPMVEQGELWWFAPETRGLMPLDERFHLPRRLRRTIRSGRFAATVNRAFEAVIDGCADRPEGSWISPEMRAAYLRLHRLGLAHSVETWPADRVGVGRPAGGLYGVALGGAFFAESMYHRVTDAGKVALVELVDRLGARGFGLCDVQWTTDHLRRFGAYDLPRDRFSAQLADALRRDCRFV